MVKTVSEQYLRTLAEYYLLRWAASTAKLQKYLERRVKIAAEKGRIVPEDAPQLIQNVIAQLKESGVLDDAVYAASLQKKLQARGYPQQKQRQALRNKGISAEDATTAVAAVESDDFTAACLYVRKRKLGRYRGFDAAEYAQKDLSALARQGFSYAQAKRALTLAAEEIDEIYGGTMMGSVFYEG
jgi:regulatory protein